MGDRSALRSSIPFLGGRGAAGFDPLGDQDDGGGTDPGGGALFLFYVLFLLAASLIPFGLVPAALLQYICIGVVVGLVAVLVLELFRSCAIARGFGAAAAHRYERIPDLPVAEPVEEEDDGDGGIVEGSALSDATAAPPEASAIPVGQPLLAILVPEEETAVVTAVTTAPVHAVAVPHPNVTTTACASPPV